MSAGLASTVCRIHVERSASFRCPSCREFFCRECSTEHDNRLFCADCIRKLTEPEEKPRRKLQFQPMPLVHAMMAITFCWLVFYLLAQLLLSVPDQFHDGTIWE